jgi:hypothetical protein
MSVSFADCSGFGQRQGNNTLGYFSSFGNFMVSLAIPRKLDASWKSEIGSRNKTGETNGAITY